MNLKHTVTTCALLLSLTVQGQEAQKTQVSYDLSTEMAVGTGDYTAYHLTSNRHHTLGTRANTGLVRGAIDVKHPLAANWSLSGGADVIAAVHADHKAYLQQLYASIQYDKFFIEIGSREHDAVLRNNLLSTGAFAKGTNAKPIPQLRIGTTDFWTVPFTKGWLQIHFEGGYGKFLDSQYREDVYNDHRDVNYKYSTGIWYHQKHLYFRSNPAKRFYVTAGVEHVAQFAGNKYVCRQGASRQTEGLFRHLPALRRQELLRERGHGRLGLRQPPGLHDRAAELEHHQGAHGASLSGRPFRRRLRHAQEQWLGRTLGC